jgi:Transcriptional regulators
MNLIIKLRDYDGYSSSEQVVADYIFNNLDLTLKMSARNLGRITNTSASNVIRLVRKLEFNSFLDFKLQLTKELTIYRKTIEIEPNFNVDKTDSVFDISTKITHLYVNAIKETQLLINQHEIEQVIKLIDLASCIDFYGLGASHQVASDVMYKFLRIGKQVSFYHESDLQLITSKVSSSERLSFVISYSGKTKEILEIANNLVLNNSPIISITALNNNPLKDLSTIPLYVSSSESERRLVAMASRTAMLYLFDVIFAGYTTKYFVQTQAMLVKTYIDNKEDFNNVRKIKDRKSE